MPTSPAKQKIKKDIDLVWEMNEEEIYKQLGLASMGTESMVEAVGSMKFIMSTAANTNTVAATKSIEKSLAKKGRNYFDRLWRKVRDIACKIYSEKLPIGDKKDLAAYIVSILASATKIGNPLLVLIVTIAIKKGLDKMCKVK